MLRDAKLFPEGLAKYIEASPRQDLIVIVSAAAGRIGWLTEELTQKKMINNLDESLIPIIDAIEVNGNGRAIAAIVESSNVESVWFIHPKMRQAYMAILRGVGHIALDAQNASQPIINLSLAPPSELLPIPFRPNEPIHRATRRATELGVLCIFAAGNGGPAQGSINPWSIAPWVVSVGACTADGELLADVSGRGIPGDQLSRPTVVAPGVDVRIPYWLNSTGEATAGEAPESGETLWSQPMTGTSFSAPVVAQTALRIAHFLDQMEQNLLASRGPSPAGGFTFAQIYDRHGPARDVRLTSERLVGTLEITGNGAFGTYPARADPLVIKQILMDMALGMPDYEPYEVGAGFVHPAIADHYFRTFGAPEIGSALRWDIKKGLLGDDE